MEPASTIITLCGGFDAVAQMTGRNPVQVRRWTYPRERGGTDGRIPSGVAETLLSEAHRKGLPLTPAHFFAVSNGKEKSPSATAAPDAEAAQ